MFFEKMKNVLDNEMNVSMTENGALGYRTTGRNLLDLNFGVSSLRNTDKDEIVRRFMLAYMDEPELALKWMFFARDIRGGLGERRLFRVLLSYLAHDQQEIAKRLICLVPEYGRFDDLWQLLDTALAPQILEMIRAGLEEDMRNMGEGQSVSLLAKWLPSINTSSQETVARAKQIAKALGYSQKSYRRTLAALRQYMDVVEVKMAARRWEEIRYDAVPSRANLIYRNAFLRNDEDRRQEFLEQLERGEVTIHSGTLFPHDIVHAYTSSNGIDYSCSLNPEDAALEALWRELPDTVQGDSSTIVVADGSGSMMSQIGGTDVSALDVANALAIYFAERCTGQYQNKYITFSQNPQLVDMSKAQSLHDKIAVALAHDEVANTDIEAVFDLILMTAVKNRLSQEEIPANILVVSDMEFDYGVAGRPDKRLFDEIARRYRQRGYSLPRLVFWNVCGRTGTIPIRENGRGVALVSGFSVNIMKMVLSGKTDPYEALVEQLNSERYAPVTEALSCKAV